MNALQVHKWVNYESMLKKCLVGRLKTESMRAPKRPAPLKVASMRPPVPATAAAINTATATGAVTSDWIQNGTDVKVIFYTRQKGLDARRVSVALSATSLRVCIYLQGNH